METFEQKLERLRALDQDEYAYHSDLKKGLREALEVIDGLLEVESPKESLRSNYG